MIGTKWVFKNKINEKGEVVRNKEKLVCKYYSWQEGELMKNYVLISQVECKNVDKACKDDYWKQAMKEELDRIEKNRTWEVVPRLADKNVIGTKWVFKNKMNQQGEVVINKTRLVCKGYSQQEGIDYEETYAPVTRIEAIWLFLPYATQKKFKVY